MTRQTVYVYVLLFAGLAGTLIAHSGCRDVQPPPTANRGARLEDSPKLYWFIPDGMRADPDVFNIYRWAAEGKLPNIKKMMDAGTYGFCVPTFPSHTPTNFATLFTGAYPEVHGVNDGPMHTAGNPLDRVSVGGFSSAAKKVEPIWVTLEKRTDAKIALLSIPGSTPPELEKGITIRGRWGGWGADFHAVNFQAQDDLLMRRLQGRSARLFFFGPQLTQYVADSPTSAWPQSLDSYAPAKEATLTAWGATTYAYLHDSTDNQQTDYDAVSFSFDQSNVLATLRQGEWSEWLPITLQWKIPNRDLATDVDTFFRIKVIKLDPDGFFRFRFFYSNLNKHVAQPEYVAGELVKGVGPMVDFVDNFPPQLIFYPEDKATFLEEAEMSLDWHRDAAAHVLDQYQPDVFIHDIYTPNQMLTSRWWMGYIDPGSARYGDVSDEQRDQLWKEVHWLYKKLDDIVGRLLERADNQTLVVVTSDHGAVPLNRWVRLNNLFAREGLLKFEIDDQTGEPRVDWDHTQAVYLKMDSVYIHPDGLGGEWHRASGAEYEELRRRVKQLLLDLVDENGVRPVERVVQWEQAESDFRLSTERAGDLIIANHPGYGWNEEMTEDGEIFTIPLKTGYKQAITSENVPGMWTPFLIMGPGVRAGHFLGDTPVSMVDQYPTIMKLLGQSSPDFVQGDVVADVLADVLAADVAVGDP